MEFSYCLLKGYLPCYPNRAKSIINTVCVFVLANYIILAQDFVAL